MKKAYILFSVLLSTAFMTNAQNTVVADASAEYLGYANVFETIANGGAYVFGSGWGVADLKISGRRWCRICYNTTKL